MTAIADSDAYLNQDRMLSQHQAALTILQGMVANPATTKIKWLDLASGKGQIIAHLKKNLSKDERTKIHYLGYDIDNSHTKYAAKIAKNLNLGNVIFEIGELSSFHEHQSIEGSWDFITLTNTIHEISPHALSSIITNCIIKLSDHGCLFIYDMESLPTPELGAILWTAQEMRAILEQIFNEFGCSKYRPSIGVWSHKTCDGWNAQIRKQHIDFPENHTDKVSDVITNVTSYVTKILENKLKQIKGALESLTRFGSETTEESQTKEKLLFDFWAVSRALEMTK
jgi:SAM-dependent methyltransferase